MQETGIATKLRLDKNDKAILSALEPIVEGIAEVVGNNCEVVLHSLEDVSHSVVKIVNGQITGRKVGSPLTDFGIDVLRKADSLESDIIGSYYTELDDRRLLKSVTILIRNSRGKPIAILCINIDLSVPLLAFVQGFLPTSSEVIPNVVEHFPSTLNELVSRTLEMVMTRVNSQREIPSSEKNKAIVRELYNRGMFKITGVIDIVAKKIGISRYTVYNYIREVRTEAEEEV